MGRGGGSSLSQCTLEITSQALKCFLGDPKCSQGDRKGNCPQDKVHQGQGLEITLRGSEVIVTLLGESAKSYLYHSFTKATGKRRGTHLHYPMERGLSFFCYRFCHVSDFCLEIFFKEICLKFLLLVLVVFFFVCFSKQGFFV